MQEESLPGAEDWKDADPEWTEYSRMNGSAYTTYDNRQLWIVQDHIYSNDNDDNNEKKNVISDKIINLFFIHGGGGRAEQWFEVVKCIRKSFLDDNKNNNICINIYIPNMLGHGRSSKPTEDTCYQFSKLIKDMECIINHTTNISSSSSNVKNYIIGHSMGSAIAMFIASKQILPIAGIILISTSHQESSSKHHPIWNCCTCFLNCIRPAISASSKGLFFHNTVSLSFVEGQERIASQNPFYMFKPLMKYSEWPSKEQMKSIYIPVLILQGDDDKIFPSDINTLKNYIGDNCEVKIVKNGGHNHFMVQPILISDSIIEFIKKY